MMRSEQASAELLAIVMLVITISLFSLALKWLSHLQACYNWLDQPPTQDSLATSELKICFNEGWQLLPQEIDYGANFQKNLDAPVLCFLEERLPELGELLECE